ncbi:MAG: undecaprenyl/decaprenyl-phosphate alpha-N-acetylglucosaminyl 1-phosphate transferase [Candidatus Levybacteria bacterium]|nr:undecaprenyl/decaprenyl-phosphate alpha-N-acetylglucosaminyl 1-phosphate transferase [Candidatus Levybacteria bacterium]
MFATQNIEVIFLPFLVAFIATSLITPFAIRLSKKIGLLDDPAVHKHPGVIHKKPIPRGGGIPMFFGAILSGILFLPINPTTVAIFFASFLALIIGVIDDRLNAVSKDVSPYIRFFINILCAVIVVGSGVTIPFITHPFGGILHLDSFSFSLFGLDAISLGDIIAIIWIIWVMNMLNWSKGVDGQMPGIVTISAIIIGLLSLRLSPNNHDALIDGTLSFIIAGCSAGFLLYNFFPARIFPGYGATSIYLLLAVVSILSSAKLATAILVMGIPTVDAGFTIVRRILAGRSPFWHDNKHLHHLLLRIGYSQRQVALFYWLISAILGTISLTLQSKSKVFAIIMLVTIVAGGLLFLHFVVKYTHEKVTS